MCRRTGLLRTITLALAVTLLAVTPSLLREGSSRGPVELAAGVAADQGAHRATVATHMVSAPASAVTPALPASRLLVLGALLVVVAGLGTFATRRVRRFDRSEVPHGDTDRWPSVHRRGPPQLASLR